VEGRRSAAVAGEAANQPLRGRPSTNSCANFDAGTDNPTPPFARTACFVRVGTSVEAAAEDHDHKSRTAGIGWVVDRQLSA